MTGLFIATWAIVGLCIGSFLNVLAYRIPKGEDFIHARSKCPSCEKPLAAQDMVPVISWLLLRGKCRQCGEKIHWRYPLVELTTAICFGLVAWHLGAVWELPAFFVFTAALITISSIDLELYIIPNRVVYPAGFICLALLIIASLADHSFHHLFLALEGSLMCWFILLVIHLIQPRGMGFGDVRLAALIGLVLGWISPARALTGIFAGFFFGAFVGLSLIALKKAGGKSAIPFGPFLAAGAFLAIFVTFMAPLESVWH